MSTEADVRELALALPGVDERTAYGTPAFSAGPRMFARFVDEPGVLLVWRADLGEREALLQEDPSAFTTTPHYDGHPSVLVRLDRVPVARLAELLREAWDARAPRRLREG